MAENDFPFIVSSGPKLQNDPLVRKLIRKQAMKEVGISRRRRENRNLERPKQSRAVGNAIPSAREVIEPGSSDTSHDGSTPSNANTSDSSGTSDTLDFNEMVLRDSATSQRSWPLAMDLVNGAFPLTPISLLSDYEATRSKFHIDITDLSVLTNFNVGKSTMTVLSANPTRIADLLGHAQWSYLKFVPSRYGFSDCITTAADCLVAKVRSVLQPHDQDTSQRVAMQLYSKALQALQHAIMDESDCLAADVLCATQLLSLYTLLDPSQHYAWSHHINGSTKLVKHRTRARFVTEFDKALFAAYVGPIVSECLLGLTSCYLEEPKWTELYRSITKESEHLTDRSALAVNVRILMFSIPRLWHDINEAATGHLLFDDEVWLSLEARCRKSHDDFVDWLESYKAHCVKSSARALATEELATRRDIYGAALECLAILKRLLSTVCEGERLKLEPQTQAIVKLILDLQTQTSSRHSWLFSGHEVGVAYTIIMTREQWEENAVYESLQESRLASLSRYNTWNNILRVPS